MHPKVYLMWRLVRKVLLLTLCFCGILVILHSQEILSYLANCPANAISYSRKTVVTGSNDVLHEYDRMSPIIFIGGVPRSGTTLMRVLLDAHPAVRCGEETRVIPRILQMRSHWMRSTKESLRLQEAGIGDEVLDSAVSSFILEIIAKHGNPSARLCNKDPFTLKSGAYLNKLFPNSKFLFMVRDGRATVNSIISRNVTITGFDLKSPAQCLKKWNTAISTMEDECNKMGEEYCLRVKYEKLVIYPKPQMEKILQFLGLPWNENVLHHERMFDSSKGIALSKVEKSSDQVIKPVNLEGLTKWVGQFPIEVIDKMASLAPMLRHFGYDPNANPPKYNEY